MRLTRWAHLAAAAALPNANGKALDAVLQKGMKLGKRNWASTEHTRRFKQDYR